MTDGLMIASGMGALVREYGGRTPRRIKLVIALGLLLLLPLGIGVVALMVMEPPRESDDWAGAIFVAAMFLGIGVLPAAIWLLRRNARVAVHEHGVVVVRGDGRRAITWDEVDTVRLEIMSFRVNGIPVGTNCKCEVTTNTGRPLVLTHWLDGVVELCHRIEDETCRRKLPHARSVLASGGSVDFGRLAVSTGGISKRGGEPLPWSEIESVAVADGFVTVRKRGKRWWWARQRCGALPNAPVLVALIRAHVPVS
jgi:hypothetical protein